MNESAKSFCPECAWSPEEFAGLNRRDFLRVAGGTALAMTAVGAVLPQASAQSPAPAAARTSSPAEALIQELHQGLTAAQRRQVVYPWNHGQTPSQLPIRLRMYNSAYGQRAGQVYTRPQQELVQRIVRAMCNGDEGYNRVRTVIETDGIPNTIGWAGIGANIFGDPSNGQYAFAISAHHLTLRCDGNSEPDAAFGGPLYYGHTQQGTSQRNIWNFQTRSAISVFDALSANQRRQALVNGSPGEMYESIRHRPGNPVRPGISTADLSPDQRRLVESVMRTCLSPFRQEDADEVMELLRRNGGIERINLAFYRDRGAADDRAWHFWRLDGPGFVWNYRILPHVHCYVNIAAQRA